MILEYVVSTCLSTMFTLKNTLSNTLKICFALIIGTISEIFLSSHHIGMHIAFQEGVLYRTDGQPCPPKSLLDKPNDGQGCPSVRVVSKELT
ncbi:hypothetical protein U27_03097 [Candidatus Vecturithrix granuli]|uniref:Uncharacterized protein n=1 Tax=Vecturithrix granuli TaxID=1499967 RepID=A0A081BUY0_VECG1|nr:hypothetical protein U27_03097 [Candidatus Vecturithrix granuli]